jgi:hypothetical protein
MHHPRIVKKFVVRRNGEYALLTPRQRRRSMKLLTNSLKVLVLIGLAAIPGRADIPACVVFAASPDLYIAPVPDSFDPNMYIYSFYVNASYTNDCPEPVEIVSYGGYGIDTGPWVYSDLFPSYGGWLAPGESFTTPHAGIVWLPGTPDGYVWEGYITRDDLGPAPFTAIAQGRVHMECDWVDQSCHATPINPIPEPGTLLLFGTGLIALASKLRMASK